MSFAVFLRFLNTRNATILLFITALSLRALFLFIDLLPTMDAYTYYESALALANGQGYVLNGKPTAYWPVGWPLLLSIVLGLPGADLLMLRVFTIALSMAEVLCVVALMRLVYPHSRIRWNTALLLSCCNPIHAAYSNLLWSETSQALLMVVMLYLYLKCYQAEKTSFFLLIVFGVILGLSSLVRATFFPLPALLFGAVWIFRKGGLLKGILGLPPSQRLGRQLFRIGSIYGVALLIVLPYSIRNYHVFKRPIFLSDNGLVNLFIGNNRYASGDYDENGLQKFSVPQWKGEIIRFWIEQPLDVAILAAKKTAYTLLEVRRTDSLLSSSMLPPTISDDQFQKLKSALPAEASQSLQEHYFAHRKNDGHIVWTCRASSEDDHARSFLVHSIIYSGVFVDRPVSKARILFFVWEQVWYYSILALSLFGGGRWLLKKGEDFSLLLMLTLAYNWGLWVLFFGSQRFAVPVLSLLIMLGTDTAFSLFRRLGEPSE